MTNGLVITNSGKKIILNRTFKSVPDYTQISQFKVGTGTTTPTAAQTDLVTPVDITAGVQSKDFVATYPIIDETAMQSTVRCLLLTTEANGNSLAEFCTVNEDGTPLMFDRMVHTPITKTASIQVIYVQKNKIKIG